MKYEKIEQDYSNIDLKALKNYRTIRRLFWILFFSSLIFLKMGMLTAGKVLIIGSIVVCVFSMVLSCPICGDPALQRKFMGNPFGGLCVHCWSRLFLINIEKTKTKNKEAQPDNQADGKR